MGTIWSISTFGRALWVLDDVTPCARSMPARSSPRYSSISPGHRTAGRWTNYEDTPYPVETPAGQNPPDGAILDYYLKSAPAGEMTLTIYDDKGGEVAKFSSAAKPAEQVTANAPDYWFARQNT